MNRSSVVAALTAAFAASNLCLGSPPVAAQEAGSVSSAEVDIGLMPGVPLAPHEIDPKPKVKIGVIDSGVRQDHPQIGNSVGDVKDFTGEGLGDSLGHGTKVALVLLHSFYSDAKNLVGPSRALLAQIEVAKVIGKKKATAQEVAGRIVQAIDWLAGHHVRVVNISLSLPEKAADYTRLCATIAEHEDMFFSIAAGNSGQEAVVYPAACSATNKIVVGAATADGKVPAYSGRADLVGRLPPAPVSVSEYWRGEGERRFRSNDLAGARQAFEKGLNANPIPQTFALLAHDLGAVAYNQAQFDDAAGWFERAIKAVPTSSQSYVAEQYSDQARAVRSGESAVGSWDISWSR